jgi:hypothetical protein
MLVCWNFFFHSGQVNIPTLKWLLAHRLSFSPLLLQCMWMKDRKHILCATMRSGGAEYTSVITYWKSVFEHRPLCKLQNNKISFMLAFYYNQHWHLDTTFQHRIECTRNTVSDIKFWCLNNIYNISNLWQKKKIQQWNSTHYIMRSMMNALT